MDKQDRTNRTIFRRKTVLDLFHYLCDTEKLSQQKITVFISDVWKLKYKEEFITTVEFRLIIVNRFLR